MNFKVKLKIYSVILLLFFLSACDTETTFAPVADINSMESIPKKGIHTVIKGETLYAIAWRYGFDYRVLAIENKIPFPYAIHPGQQIALRKCNKINRYKPILTEAPLGLSISKTPLLRNQSTHFLKWIMPAKGRIIQSYSSFHKGINITGHLADPIYATADGKVVYCGNGLRGYGNLIIIKHNSLYLSAYAHNRIMFVKEGDIVKQGQKIAEMGDTGTNKVLLHFEIRRAGRPINPITLLKT